MRKLFIVLLVALLAACSSAPTAGPTQPPAPTVEQPTNTPVVIVQTVVVEATQKPTDVPQPTPIPPTAVPPTAQQPVVVTVVVQATADQSQAAQPTQAQPTQAQPAVSSGGVTIDNTLGHGVFTNMTMSGNNLTLRCSPRDITFNVTTSNIDIKDTLFYYRIVDLKRQYPSEWKNFGKMTANGNGNFTLTFKGEDVDSNIRIDGSWLDFQFVGLNKTGDVLDRSDKITELVKYTFDCP
jgi:hypothetical protein